MGKKPALVASVAMGLIISLAAARGGGGMPAFSASQISDQQLNDLAAYVGSLK